MVKRQQLGIHGIPMVWVTFCLMTVGAAICIARYVPIEYRRRYQLCAKDWEYWLATACFNGIWIVAAIEARYAASPSPPLPLRLAGAMMMIGGLTLVIWARRVNPFWLPSVVRPDYIVRTGPYAYLKHPGYLGLGLIAEGMFFFLGQWLSLFPLFAYLLLIELRILIEDRFLSTISDY